MASLKASKALPENFAVTVMDLEMEIESGRICSEAVNKLTTMYMDAVEYYAAFESEKYHYFQEKLTRLLSNQKVHDQLALEAPKEKKSGDNGPKVDSTALKFNSKKQMELNLIMGEKKAQDLTKQMLKTFGSSHFEMNMKIKDNLNSQATDIAKRLEERKLKRSASQQKLTLGSSSLASSKMSETEGIPDLNMSPVALSRVNGPLTPRQQTSEDPYGFGSIGKKASADQPTFTKESLLEPTKTEPGKGKSAKANFFSKLKKTNAKDEAKNEDAEKQVSAFDSGIVEQKQPVVEHIQAEAKEVETEQTKPTPSPTQSPKRTGGIAKLLKKASNKPKLVIKVAKEEEVNALKEELEMIEMQLAEEIEEDQKLVWQSEIDRVKSSIDQLSIETKEQDVVTSEVLASQTEVPEEATNNDIVKQDTVLENSTDESNTLLIPSQVAEADALSDQADKKSESKETSSPGPKKKNAVGGFLSKLKNKSKKED